MDDTFRLIEGFPGYRVSRLGEVHSCWSRHAHLALMTDAWLPMSPVIRHGCPTVNLCRGSRKTVCRIHRLVLECFVGPYPPGMLACHNDGNRANNCVSNLRWDTPKANSDDTLRHGRRARGSRCWATKLTEDEVVQIRRLRDEGVPPGEVASRFGVTYQNVLAIVSRVTWNHLPTGHVGAVITGLAGIEGQCPRPGAA